MCSRGGAEGAEVLLARQLSSCHLSSMKEDLRSGECDTSASSAPLREPTLRRATGRRAAPPIAIRPARPAYPPARTRARAAPPYQAVRSHRRSPLANAASGRHTSASRSTPRPEKKNVLARRRGGRGGVARAATELLSSLRYEKKTSGPASATPLRPPRLCANQPPPGYR